MTLSQSIAHSIVDKGVAVTRVTEVLQKYNLLSLLPEIRKSVTKLMSREQESGSVYIETPFPLSQDALSTIKEISNSSEAPHTVVINKNILAGFTARYKNTLYDGSAERIIKQLTTNN